MTLDKRLSNCAVIGAAGKMGRGIVLVLLKEMISTDLRLKRPLSELICIDRSAEGLASLRKYLNVQMLKFAERNISKLRTWYQDDDSLVDNGEMIDHFLKQCRSILNTDSSYTFLENTNMVFEAIFEDLNIKGQVYSEIKNICPKGCLYFSNTSSIPISELNYRNDLYGKIIGFHFYNPPAVQKLVEVITIKQNAQEDIDLSLELIKRLNKLAVPSNDVAGFIGNGHFIREGLAYIREVDKLPYSNASSLFLINEITQKLMFRPMGIFQLIDYVGIDVFSMICKTMGTYIEEDFSAEVLNRLIEITYKGGQYGDGSQKDGFFIYEQGKIKAVFDWKIKEHLEIDFVQKELANIKFPELSENWKSLSRSKNLDYIKNTFESYLKSPNLTENKAIEYINSSRRIAQDLVKNGVAEKIEDVNDVMTNGFFHLYGPASDLLDSIPEADHE